MVWSTIFRADAAQDAAEPAPAPWLAPALQPSTLAALVALRHAALFRFVNPPMQLLLRGPGSLHFPVPTTPANPHGQPLAGDCSQTRHPPFGGESNFTEDLDTEGPSRTN